MPSAAGVRQVRPFRPLRLSRLLVHIAVAKYDGGLPLWRQKAIYARDWVALGRLTRAQWDR